MRSKRLWAEWLFDGERWISGVDLRIGGDGRLISLERGRPESESDVFGCIIPALVNAHVHLDLPRLRSRPAGGFVDWIREVIRERASLDTAATEALVLQNLKDLIDSGCACVADVDSTGASQGAFARLDIEGRRYRELIGFDLDAGQADEFLDCLDLQAGDGLSPHAPYSVSDALFRAAKGSGRPLMIHCSETPEELVFLREGRGPFRQLLEDLGRIDGGYVAPACSPLAWLDALSCLGPQTLLIHVQELVAGDLDILARAGSPVVICPGSILYFHRDAPAISQMWDAGLTLALGTDSLASNEELDLFGEMQRLQMLAADLDPHRILRMATSMGGKALGIPHAGRFIPGARFDALGFRDSPGGSSSALSEWVCCSRPRPDARFAGSRR